MRRRLLLASGLSPALGLSLGGCADTPLQGSSSQDPPRLRSAPELAALAPAAPREFRAVWVATVANIDWPSRKGLSTAQQQANESQQRSSRPAPASTTRSPH